MVFARGTDTGHLNGTFLDPALIKRVEIVRGPSALLYGSGALGGVISYDTSMQKIYCRKDKAVVFVSLVLAARGTITWD